MSHAPEIDPDPATLPPADGISVSGGQLAVIMGVTLLIALVVLDLVSG